MVALWPADAALITMGARPAVAGRQIRRKRQALAAVPWLKIPRWYGPLYGQDASWLGEAVQIFVFELQYILQQPSTGRGNRYQETSFDGSWVILNERVYQQPLPFSDSIKNWPAQI